MKKCNKCNCELIPETNWMKSLIKNSTYTCKSCWNKKTRAYKKNNPASAKLSDKKWREKKGNAISKKWNQKQKDGYHYVYHIADGNYVGVTCNLYARKSTHKNGCNGHPPRDLNKGTGFQILSRHTFRKEALQVESYLHSLGFNGGGNNNDFLKSNI